ncbi:MAG: matrixin family metalloprotease, partial [Planktothrix sp.]
YLPLNLVEEPENADIEIIRKNPPLDPQKKRASSAETRYQVSVKYTPEGFPYLSHRFTIWLSPTQTGKYIEAAILHEFGHALGIWGHSPEPTDVMYFSQVREPPPISARDINTLKRIYQQPTRLGWAVL